MITQRTVLILGAGASYPYGFPLATGLYQNVVHIISKRDPEQPARRILRELNFSDDDIDDFVRDLKHAEAASVDTFLQGRPEYLEIGKRALAALLLPQEQEARLFTPENSDDHWYRYLWGLLAPNPESLGGGRISVITFNYDRSLEHYLYTALGSRFGLGEDECRSRMSSLPIVHAYGQLGALPWQDGKSLHYGVKADAHSARTAAEGIRLIAEEREENGVSKEIEDLVSRATLFIFLGFGFHPDNLELLRLTEKAGCSQRDEDVLSVCGTVYGHTEFDCRHIQNYVSRLFLGSPFGVAPSLKPVKCLQFFREGHYLTKDVPDFKPWLL